MGRPDKKLWSNVSVRGPDTTLGIEVRDYLKNIAKYLKQWKSECINSGQESKMIGISICSQ